MPLSSSPADRCVSRPERGPVVNGSNGAQICRGRDNIKFIAIPAIGLIAGLGLAACGTTVVQPAAVKPAATTPAATTPAATTPAAAASAPQIIINNNNAAAPAPTQPAQPAPQPAAQSDPWGVVLAYVNDVNDGDASDVWNMLGPARQATWNNNYNTLAAWVSQTSITNVNEVSEYGDTVTWTFDLSNSAGTNVPYTDTLTVVNGIITSDTSSQT